MRFEHTDRRCECFSSDEKLELVFQSIDAAADLFELEHGQLAEGSDFELYGRYLSDAVLKQNSVDGVERNPDIVLECWLWHYENCVEKDALEVIMEEALEGTPIGK